MLCLRRIAKRLERADFDLCVPNSSFGNMEIWTTVFMMLLFSGPSMTKKLEENKENANNISKKVLKVDVETAKEKRQITSTEVFGVGGIPLAAPQQLPAQFAGPPPPLATSVSLEPNPVILRQEVPRYITRTITRDVPVSVPVAVRTPVVVPVDRPVAVPVLHRVPYEVTKHVPVYYETKVPFPVKVHVPVPYPVTVEKHVPVDRPVYVDRPVPHPVYVDRQVSVPQPVFLNRPLPQPFFVQRQVAFPQFMPTLPDFPDIPFGLSVR